MRDYRVTGCAHGSKFCIMAIAPIRKLRGILLISLPDRHVLDEEEIVAFLDEPFQARLERPVSLCELLAEPLRWGLRFRRRCRLCCCWF